MSKGVTWTPKQMQEYALKLREVARIEAMTSQELAEYKSMRETGLTWQQASATGPKSFLSALGQHAKKQRKYKNKHCFVGLTRFHSLAERDRYLWWLQRPTCLWVDVHPKVTLDAEAGIYYRPDLCVWLEHELGNLTVCHFEDIKSEPTIKKQSFRDRWKLFDAHHPAAPLWVVTRAGAGLKGNWLIQRRGYREEVQI